MCGYAAQAKKKKKKKKKKPPYIKFIESQIFDINCDLRQSQSRQTVSQTGHPCTWSHVTWVWRKIIGYFVNRKHFKILLTSIKFYNVCNSCIFIVILSDTYKIKSGTIIRKRDFCGSLTYKGPRSSLCTQVPCLAVKKWNRSIITESNIFYKCIIPIIKKEYAWLLLTTTLVKNGKKRSFFCA